MNKASVNSTVKTIAIAALLSLAAAAHSASDSLDQATAREQCQTAASSSQAGQSDFAFRSKMLSSYRSGRFTFMFNYSALEAGDKVFHKVKCVITKAGKIEELGNYVGSWRF